MDHEDLFLKATLEFFIGTDVFDVTENYIKTLELGEIIKKTVETKILF